MVAKIIAQLALVGNVFVRDQREVARGFSRKSLER